MSWALPTFGSRTWPSQDCRGRALAVVPREVVNAVCGDGATDGGVGSVVIVVMEPGPIGRSPCFVTCVGPGIGPLVRKRAVEAFDFAVRLRTIGPGAAMAR